MKKENRLWLVALIMTAMMVVPAVPGLAEESRAAPQIVRKITTLGDGSTEQTISFSDAGTDNSLTLKIPNGAKVLSAKLNITGLSASGGGLDYPQEVTFDVGEDGILEWAFDGKGYGSLGEQTLISNATNSTPYYKLPFYKAGTNETARIRVPKRADVKGATMELKGSSGTGPSTVSTVTQMQSWAPNNWVQSNPAWVNSLNGQILYGLIQFDLSSIPDTVFVSDATFWWGRQGTSPYHQWGYSFADQLGAYRLEESWSVPTQKVLKESAAESTNMMTNARTYYDWKITNMMGTWAEGEHANWGLCIHRTQPAIQDKWDYAITTPYISVQYGTPSDVIVKIKGSTAEIFQQSGLFDTSVVTDDFSAGINTYVTNQSATMTDAYGNEFVDIPLSVSSTTPGRVNMTNLELAYDYTAVVDENPSTGSLASALNELIDPATDGGNTEIKLAIFSNHTGKVKVSGVNIDYKPPDHWASIDMRSPEEDYLEMSENSSISFAIEASDLYGYPLNATWYMSGMVYQKNSWNMTWYADFDANGTYNVTVKVDNGLHLTLASWKLVVKNVNRRPIIESFRPDAKVDMDENSSMLFDVTASDPDGDRIGYAWSLDGRSLGLDESQIEYRTNYSMAGQHSVKVVVRDALNLDASVTWSITVKEVNAEPEIAETSPGGAEEVMAENQTRQFTVVDRSVDGDKQSISWRFDGKPTGVTTKTYSYTADYNSSGRHTVEVEVSDGKLSVTRTWGLTVLDVNRPPVARIDSPGQGAEFMTWNEIQLSGASSFDPDGDPLNMTWTEGKKVLGYGSDIVVRLSRGKHTLTLTVDDGKKNGLTRTQVDVTVRYLDFVALLQPDLLQPVEGQTVKLTVTLTNKGDGGTTGLPVSFLVDGVEATNQTIDEVLPDSDYMLEFTWKAVRGDHKLQVRVMDQNFSRVLTVVKKPAPPPAVSADLMPIIGISAIVAVVAVAGVGAYMYTTKRKGRAPAGQQVPAPPAAAVPYSAAAPAVPAVQEEARALQLLKQTEAALVDAEAISLDTAKARQTLAIAKNFYEMGKYSKAIQYCQSAQDMIG